MSRNSFSIVVKCAILLGVGGLIAQRDRVRVRFWQIAHAAPAIHPYTVHVREISTGLDGMAPIVHDYVRAVRSGGSEVEITRGPSKEMRSGIYEAKLIKLAEGLAVDTRNDTRIKTSRRRNPQYGDFSSWWGMTHRDPASDCLRLFSGHTATTPSSEKITGESTIGGLRALEVTVSGTGNGLKVWMAPDLGCELVRQDLTFFAEGKQTGTSEKRLVSYSRGEPDPKLFEVPENFEEVSPREAYLRYQRLYRHDPTFNAVPERQRALLDRWEREYAIARVN